MTGVISQIIALVCYTNDFLMNKSPFSFDLSNSTAQYCNNIRYIYWVKKLIKFEEQKIADNPSDWVEFLKENGVKMLWMHYASNYNPGIGERYAAAFANGGGRWLIEAYNGKTSDFWESNWDVSDRNAKDKRIWSVTYGLISRNDNSRITALEDLNIVSQRLKSIFEKAFEFANNYEYLSGFKNCFKNALTCLESSDPLKYIYHKDLVPGSFNNMKALQILSACQCGWVFGGMGSWNDLWFEGEEQKKYEEISDQLYYSICNSIPIATNSLCKG